MSDTREASAGPTISKHTPEPVVNSKQQVTTPASESETKATPPPAIKATPSSNKKATANPKPKTPASKKRAANVKEEEGTPSKKAKWGPIPTSAADLSENDSLMLKWKDEEGLTWAAIDKKWTTHTGTPPGHRTLAKRYARLKAALSCISAADLPLLKATVDETKAAIEEEKKALDKKLWSRVAEAMEEKGGQKYEPGTVEKDWKKLITGAAEKKVDVGGDGRAAEEEGVMDDDDAKEEAAADSGLEAGDA